MHAAEVVGRSHRLDEATELLLDVGDLLGFGFVRIGVAADLAGEVLVADANAEAVAGCERRREPGLQSRPCVVADPLELHPAGLVVPDVEQTVVDPHRVEAAGGHEHGCGRAVEAREVELVPRGLAGGGATEGMSFDEARDRTRAVEAVSRQQVFHERVVVAGTAVVDHAQERVDEVADVGRRSGVALGQAEQVAVPVLARAPVPSFDRARTDRDDVGEEAFPHEASQVLIAKNARRSPR